MNGETVDLVPVFAQRLSHSSLNGPRLCCQRNRAIHGGNQASLQDLADPIACLTVQGSQVRGRGALLPEKWCPIVIKVSEDGWYGNGAHGDGGQPSVSE
jgi:hypothetical protein